MKPLKIGCLLFFLTIFGSSFATAEGGFFGKMFVAKFGDSDYLGRWYEEGDDFYDNKEDGVTVFTKWCGTMENFENHTSNFRGIARYVFKYSATKEGPAFDVTAAVKFNGASEWVIKDQKITKKTTANNYIINDIGIDTFGRKQSPDIINNAKKMMSEKVLEVCRSVKPIGGSEIIQVKSFDKDKIIFEQISEEGKPVLGSVVKTNKMDGECH